MNQFGGKRSGRICCLTSKVKGEQKPNAHMANASTTLNHLEAVTISTSHNSGQAGSRPKGGVRLGRHMHNLTQYLVLTFY